MSDQLTPAEEELGLRADIFVAQKLDVTRSYAKKLLDGGKITANGSAVSPSDKVVSALEYSHDEAQLAPIDIPVLYEDDDVVVINKPSGMLTHAKGPVAEEFTVADFMKPLTTDESSGREGIVHRLDRVTSGVLICAKSSEARVRLQKQFANRTVQKTYNAIVEGRFEPSKQRFEWPIERNPKKPSTFRVGTQGKSAATEAALLEKKGQFSLLSLKPVTGRTHQLRVHLSHANRPIVGDEMYGGKKASRLMLHAFSLQLTVPNGENMTFSAPLPEEFARYV